MLNLALGVVLIVDVVEMVDRWSFVITIVEVILRIV